MLVHLLVALLYYLLDEFLFLIFVHHKLNIINVPISYIQSLDMFTSNYQSGTSPLRMQSDVVPNDYSQYETAKSDTIDWPVLFFSVFYPLGIHLLYCLIPDLLLYLVL